MNLRLLTTEHRRLLYIVIAAILTRAFFILVLDPRPPITGNDVGFYLLYGPQLIRNIAPPLAPAPVYLVYVGIIQLLIPSDAQTVVQVIRLLNIGWHIVLIVSVYAMGKRYFSLQAAQVAAAVLAINPIFIIEAGQPVTESLYLGILFGTLALYAAVQDKPRLRILVIVGLLLGIATLTRAVLLLFPLVLMIHLVRLHGWRQGLRFGVVLIFSYGVMVSTWTIYNLVRWDRMVVGAEGAIGFTWMGIHGQQSPETVDQSAGTPATSTDRNNALAGQIAETVLHNLPEYVKTRLSNLVEAYLQPHNTVYFAGESVKELAGNWLRSDRSLSGLLALTSADAFWPKLLLYLFHFWAILFGIAGMVLWLSRFWCQFPLYGYVLYTTTVHSILLAIPRYLLPVQPILILFASAATLRLAERFVVRRSRHVVYE